MAALGVLLGGCHRTEPHSQEGTIKLVYVGSSENDVVFMLENHSTRVIHVRAEESNTNEILAWPNVTELECDAGSSRSLQERPFPMVDGVWRRAQVAPGESARLRVVTKIPQLYKGRRCELTLRLDDGVSVGPAAFSP